DFLARFEVPDADRPVPTRRQAQLAVGRHRHGVDRSLMSLELLQLSGTLAVLPQAGHPVLAAGKDFLAIRREDGTADRPAQVLPRPLLDPRRGDPETDAPIVPTGDDLPAVRRKGDV